MCQAPLHNIHILYAEKISYKTLRTLRTTNMLLECYEYNTHIITSDSFWPQIHTIMPHHWDILLCSLNIRSRYTYINTYVLDWTGLQFKNLRDFHLGTLKDVCKSNISIKIMLVQNTNYRGFGGNLSNQQYFFQIVQNPHCWTGSHLFDWK